jgi:hypothetical protein
MTGDSRIKDNDLGIELWEEGRAVHDPKTKWTREALYGIESKNSEVVGILRQPAVAKECSRHGAAV